MIEPGYDRANYQGHRGRRLEHAFFTADPGEAKAYARNSRRDGIQRVYQVEPTGEFEPDDPRGHPDYRSAEPLRVVREVWHDTSWGDDPNPLAAQHGLGDHVTAARWRPDSGIFAPTTGFDSRLFDGHHNLRPEVRGAVMERLDQALRVDGGLVGSDWQKYLRVYLAGGSASEWAGNRPNDTAEDLDILIGVAYDSYRGSQPGNYQPPDRAIDSELNAALRAHFNDPAWHAPFGGIWSVTGFVNAAAYDIKVLKPYAAWDISNMTWAVRPPHLPEHSLDDFDPAVLAEARAFATMARAVLRMSEPDRTRQARALWEHIHADRSRAFSAEGEGWQDAGNVVEKYLAYAPGGLLNRIKDLALTKTAAAEEQAGGPYYHGSGKRYREGDLIDPAQPHKKIHPQSDPGKAYFSDSYWNAQNWANVASPSGNGHVYEVEPTGPHEEDPHYSGPEERGIYDLSVSPIKRIDVRQTGHPLRVIRKMPPWTAETAIQPKIAAGRKYEDIGQISYSHREEEPGKHRFDAHDEWDNNVGYAAAEEKPSHVFIDSIYVRPGARGHGIASKLLDNVTSHFPGRELRLKPNPFENDRWREPDDAPDEDVLREFYRSRGFRAYDRQPGDPWDAAEHMTKQAAVETREEQLAAMDPHSRASAQAQEHVRYWHPRLTMSLGDHPSGRTNLTMAGWLRDAGHPRAEESYVARHPRPELGHSNSGRGPDGEPMVVLHPERWDYGTMAHETAHLIHDFETGRLINGPQPEHGPHNDRWAGHYARLMNKISPEAGDDYLAERRKHLGLSAEASAAPLCRLCHEPLDDEDIDNESSSHEECAQAHWCEAHQEEHDDPVEAQQHNDTYTDWGAHLPFGHGIHRGFPVQLPREVHEVVHDQSRPLAERARALREHLDANPSEGMGLQRDLTDEEKYGQTGHFGVHWTDSEPHARGWGEDDYYEGHGNGGVKPYVTHVTLHARSPEREHIEDDPDELNRRHMWGFDHEHSEREVPLKVGAPVHLTGISWKHGGQDEWNRHDFPEGSQHTAAAAQAAYLHGSPNRIEPGAFVHQDAMPKSDGRLKHNYFTTDRDVAEDAADMRDGRGHGWIHTVEPTGPYEVDHGEPDSWRSEQPLRVLSVEPARSNGSSPHPLILREAGKNGELPEGVTFVHFPSEGHFDPHTIYARHPDAPDDEVLQQAGHIRWWGDTGTISTIRVHPDYQRRGLATELFRRAQEVTPNIHHSDALSEQGKDWKRSLASSDGDRWVTCAQGHEHWGAYGAAGLLIRHRGDDSKYRYLLQKRSDDVDKGGTWSIPAGAKGKDESPEDGALREAREEIGSLPRGLTHHHTVKSTDCGDWAFHTVVMDSPEHFMPRGGGETEHETAGTAWHTAREVEDLRKNGDLHPAFAKSWDMVRRSRGPQKTAAGGRDRVERIHPRDLMQYVETYRTDDEGGRRHRQDLAEKIRQKGYQPRLHGGMSGDTHFSPPSSPITLVHEDHASYFLEGNHRVHALNDIGYDKPVPVLVKDRRSQGPTEQASVLDLRAEGASNVGGWNPASGIRMVPPEEYRKYAYPDYPVKNLPGLAKHLRKRGPAYYQALRDDVEANGVQAPILVRHQMAGRALKRPQVMDGHHRAAVAFELGLHMPVGDYDNEEHYQAAAEHGRMWLREHEELKAQGEAPWRKEAAEEGLSGPWYHGTNVDIGVDNLIEPGHQKNFGEGKSSHVYFTESEAGARGYANWAVGRRGGEPHVYEVDPERAFRWEPVGEARPAQSPKEYKSRNSLRVLRELPAHEPIEREAVKGYDLAPRSGAMQHEADHQHPYVMRQPDGSLRCPECGEAVEPKPVEPRPRKRKYKGVLEFRERPLNSDLARSGENRFELSAHHPEYGQVGQLNFARHGDDDPDCLSISGITVDRDHERRGVASALMAELENRHPGVPINHGDRSYKGMLWAHRYYKTPRFRLNPDHPDDYHGGWTIDKKVVSRDEAQAEIEQRRTRKTASAGETYYHASDEEYEPGEEIDPSRRHHQNWKESDPAHIYFTNSRGSASPWGENVYVVHPVGPHETDKRFPKGIHNEEHNTLDSASYQTRYPLKIVRRLSDDELSFRDPDEWDHLAPREAVKEEAAGHAVLYHSGGKDFLGDEEWVHLGTRKAALNRAKDWNQERERRGDPAAPVYLHTVKLSGSHYPSERSDNEANDPVWRDIATRDGHNVLPYLNEYEDPGTTSYLAHRSAVHLVKTEPLADEEIDRRWDEQQHHYGVKGYDLAPRSAMIYLDIPNGLIRQVPGGVDESHITLVYLGKDVGDEAFQRACLRAQAAAAKTQPLKGVLHGIETFPPSDSSDQKTPAFVPAYIPGIGKLRRELEDLSASEHKHYRPHVTLGYYGEDEELLPPHPPVHLTFTHLSLKRGDDVVSFPFEGHLRRDAQPPRTAAYEDASEEARGRRRERVERYLDRNRHPGVDSISIPSKWGPWFRNSDIHQIIGNASGGTFKDEHWEHLPYENVSLRQPIHQHQDFVYPDTVKQKIRETFGDDNDLGYEGGEDEGGGPDSKFVRHQGNTYLLDGHHRYAEARLMGHSSMGGRVYDTANSEHDPRNCYECHENDAGEDYDHDSDECETCQEHGWRI